MNSPDDDSEARLAEMLADYETRLAAGECSTAGPDVRTPASERERRRLESAKACLERLEQIWPHARPGYEEAPETIDHFRIVRELGRGGFGIVYLARDEKLGRDVALKVQRPEALLSPALRERFLREARAAARLAHPHLAGVYEVGEAGLRIWIASQYIEGCLLRDWLRRQASPPAAKSAAAAVAALADAVDYAHRQGVLHRDLKPSNVLLQSTSEGASDADLSRYTPRLIDFGLAKLDEVGRDETRTGALIGTPAYMAPEQTSGNTRAIGPATDVYGLGTILYELLTLRPAFRGENDVQTLRAVAEVEPLRPRRIRGELPADLEAICLKCLEKDPRRRYASAGALADDLRRFLADRPTLARPLGLGRRLTKWARRRPALAGLIVVSLLAAAFMVFGTAAYMLELQRGRETAERLRHDAEASAATARQQEEVANRHLYAARMRLAYEMLVRGDGARAIRLLEPYESSTRLAHLRGFEWYHLKRRTHAERMSLAGHQGQVYGVAFSPDGNTLASGGQDGLIKLWNPTDGRELATLRGHTSCVNDLAYSPDGQLLVSVSCDSTVKFWNARTHELLTSDDAHRGEVHCLAFSPDGTRLVTGGKALQLVIWDMAARAVEKTRQLELDVNTVAWRDNQSIIVERQDGPERPSFLALMNLETGQLWPLGEPGRTFVVSPDGQDALVAGDDGSIRSMADISARQLARSGRGYSCRSLHFSADGKWLAAACDDATVRLWRYPELDSQQVLTGHTDRVQTVAFSPSCDRIASASFDGTVKVWSLESEAQPRIESAFVTTAGSRVALSDDLRYAALPSGRQQVSVVDLELKKAVARVDTPDIVLSLEFSRPEALTVFGCSPESVWKWDWQGAHESTQPIASTPGRMGNGVCLMRQGRHLAAFDRRPTLFEVSSGRLWWEMKNAQSPVGARSLEFSPDGRLCAIGANDHGLGFRSPAHQLALVDLATMRTIHHLTEGVLAVANGGQTAIVGRPLLEVAVIEIAAGRELFRIPHEKQCTAAAFSPDGRTIATGTAEGRISLWHVATGQFIAQFETDRHQVVTLRFSSDGTRLAAATVDHLDNQNPQSARIYVWSGADDR